MAKAPGAKMTCPMGEAGHGMRSMTGDRPGRGEMPGCRMHGGNWTDCSKPDCCMGKAAWSKKAHRGCPLPPDQCWGYCRTSMGKADAPRAGCDPAACPTPCGMKK